MTRLRFLVAALLALAFACSSIQLGRTQQGQYPDLPQAASKPAADDPCVIYSLTEMGYDTALGSWIADVMPEMIEPSSWKNQGGMGAIRYYAHKNILVVKQTKAIQKKVDGFLKDLKTSMPKASAANPAGKKTPPACIVPADYREPALLRTSNQASESSYPVPAAVKPPKHLFHFIIRYEGDGIIDDNVVKFMKAQLQGAKSPVSVGSTCTVVAPPAVNVNPPSPSYSAAPPAAFGSPAPAPEPAGSISIPNPSAQPAQPDGWQIPSAAPTPPSPAPKKKKGKKDDQKEQSTRIPAYAR